MSISALEGLKVIDVDSHVTEPEDLWTSRMPKKFIDQAPRLVPDAESGRRHWTVGGYKLLEEVQTTHSGWREFFPSHPPSFAEADPAGWDPQARLRRLDEHGIYAQLMYPNIIGFQIWAFMDMGDPDLSLACVQAYNDFQTDWASADPKRLIPITIIPIWDVEACVKEVTRCAERGHRGINFGVQVDRIGLPVWRTGHWDPLFSAAQDLGMSINFHIGFQIDKERQKKRVEVTNTDPLGFVGQSALGFAGNLEGIAEVILSRTAHRFPRLNFVSVESGYGYVPYLLEALDWQFKNSQAPKEFPDMLLPSEYFRRQIYATFWFESLIDRQIDLYPDNVMFESDFPHPTSLSPGPGTHALNARETIESNLAQLDPQTLRKVLHDTAAKVYRLD